MLRHRLLPSLALVAALLGAGRPAAAQDFREPAHAQPLTNIPASASCIGHFGGSPFSPPQPNDMTFVTDTGYDLDSGCTFRIGGPLVFNVDVTRVVGDLNKLRQNGLIGTHALLRMPAFDVDFDAVVPPYAPERDQVFFNGHLVDEVYLTGFNNVWKLNTFRIPIEWINFPSDPGDGGTVQPAANTIRIDIDTANSEEVWCTSIDWAALSIECVRPVIMNHGILSSGVVWNDVWTAQLDALGIPYGRPGDHGNLDSIGNNAQKIANEVSAAKARFGVDKVIMIGHSKGGLDSRHYIESNQDVEQLIQLGTPNAGSPLADVAQAGAIYFLGLPAAIIVNALAGPAGVQLTTPYMAAYNAAHGFNPDCSYTALAGNYDPGSCGFFDFGCHVDQVLLGITGPGDTIVPIWSVHALGYTQNMTLSTFGADQQAKHTSIEKSQSAFSLVRSLVMRKGTPLRDNCGGNLLLASLTPTLAGLPARQMLTSQSGHATLAPSAGGPGGGLGPENRTATRFGVLNPGQVQTHTLPIDSGANTAVVMFYPSGNLDMVLISPGGTRYDAAAVGTLPGFAVTDQEILGGRVEAFSFANMDLGTWTVEVHGTSVIEPTGAGYTLSAWFTNPAITLVGDIPNPAVSLHEPLVLKAHPRNGTTPITGATVQALLGTPDNQQRTQPMNDAGLDGDAVAGDGEYTGTFINTDVAGLYRIVFTVESAGPPAFSRETFCTATVSESGSSLQGPFQDSGVDDNLNGFYDRLLITCNAQVNAAAHYRVFGTLEDALGNTQDASMEADLAPGTQPVTLAFDGARLFNNRVDGPYHLTRITLAEVRNGDILPRHTLLNPHTTAAYTFGQFEHGPIVFTGQGFAFGVDTDGNSKYNYLDVQLGLELQLDGYYQWSARLTDPNGQEVGFAAGQNFLPAGPNTLDLQFDGLRIGSSALNGPYTVRDLLVYGAGASFVGGVAFITPPFQASDFEGFGTDTRPPSISLKMSPKTLLPADHSLRKISALLTVSDDLDPHPTVRLISIVSSESDFTGGNDLPNDIQGAAYGTADKEFFLRAERLDSGFGRSYQVTYEAADAAGNTTRVTQTILVPFVRRIGVITAADDSLAASSPALMRVGNAGAALPVSLAYWLPAAGDARVSVFDVSGRLVAELQSGPQDAGEHLLQWDGRDAGGQRAPQGLYFVRLVTSIEGREERSVVRVAVTR